MTEQQQIQELKNILKEKEETMMKFEEHIKELKEQNYICLRSICGGQGGAGGEGGTGQWAVASGQWAVGSGHDVAVLVELRGHKGAASPHASITGA